MENWKNNRPDGWDIMDYCSVEEQGDSPLLAMNLFEAGADAMLKEVVKWLKAHHRGSHRGFGHYGIYDSEIKDLLKEVE